MPAIRPSYTHTSDARAETDSTKKGRHHNYNITFRNKVTGELEKLRGSTRPYAHIGERKETRTPHTPKTRPPTRWNCSTYWIQSKVRNDQHQKRNEELARLVQERNRLEAIIEAAKTPLIKRIETPSTSPSLAERLAEKPSIDGIHLRKEKHIQREKEYRRFINGTSNKLNRIRNRYPGIDSEIFGRFNLLKINFENHRCDRFTNKTWRHIEKDCKAIGKVSLELGKDYVEMEFKALTRQGVFLYE